MGIFSKVIDTRSKSAKEKDEKSIQLLKVRDAEIQNFISSIDGMSLVLNKIKLKEIDDINCVIEDNKININEHKIEKDIKLKEDEKILLSIEHNVGLYSVEPVKKDIVSNIVNKLSNKSELNFISDGNIILTNKYLIHLEDGKEIKFTLEDLSDYYINDNGFIMELHNSKPYALKLETEEALVLYQIIENTFE